jgi:DNA-binding MarR family transcriptional regulator
MSTTDDLTAATVVDEERRQTAIRGLEHEIAALLRRIRRGLADRAVQVHPELNATTYMMVSVLEEQGPRRAADLAETFALDKGSVSRAVHQLVELGLIVRTPDPADGRASILAVTDDAVRRLGQVHTRRRETFDHRLAAWPVDEIEVLAAGLGRFNLALSDPRP